MPMALSVAPLYSLGLDNWNNVQHDLFGHLLPLMPVSVSHDASSIINAPFHLSGQDDQNEMQHDLFGHKMPLALGPALCDA